MAVKIKIKLPKTIKKYCTIFSSLTNIDIQERLNYVTRRAAILSWINPG